MDAMVLLFVWCLYDDDDDDCSFVACFGRGDSDKVMGYLPLLRYYLGTDSTLADWLTAAGARSHLVALSTHEADSRL